MTDKADVVVVCTTLDKEGTARGMARNIVEARLAACVQCVPIHSTYRWKDAVEEACEFLLTAKTVRAAADRLVEFIRSRHSYEVPEILILPVEGGLPSYLDWIRQETSIEGRD